MKFSPQGKTPFLAATLCAALAMFGCALTDSEGKSELDTPAPAKGEILPLDVSDLYMPPNSMTSIKFKGNLNPELKTVKCGITDIWEKEIGSKEAAISKDGTFSLDFTLPQGYYEISFPETKQAFGICALPRYSGAKDPFFNIDCALSWWLCHKDLNRTIGMIRLLGKCGVSLARERIYSNVINPSEGKYRFGADVYEKVRQAYLDNGMKTLEMTHDAPAFLRPCLKSPYPQDFEKLSASWNAISSKWGKYWGGFEIWNEPDLDDFGGGMPLDQMVPLLQAETYVLRKQGLEIPVGGPPFALHGTGSFIETLPQSGVLDNLDYMSFHYYPDALGLEAVIANYRAWLASHSKESMPIWITEAGSVWKENRPPRPKFEDCMHFALEIARKTVESKACGIERHFPFVYAYYGQHKKGMMGVEGTPLRAMAAYSQCVRALSNKSYAGDLNVKADGFSKIRVFESGDEMVAVLCAAAGKSDDNAKAYGLPAIKAEGLDGRKLALPADGVVQSHDGLTYVWLDTKKAEKLLDRNSETMRLWKIGRAPAPERTLPSPVVFQFKAADAICSADGYFLGRERKLIVTATNISDEARDVSVSLELPEAWVGKGACVKTLSLPPRSHLDLEWELALNENYKFDLAKPATSFIKIKSAAQDGHPGNALAIPVIPKLSESEYLAKFANCRKLDISDMSRWDNNAAEGVKTGKSVTSEGAVSFHIETSKKIDTVGFWAHPLFKLSETEMDLRGCWLLLTARSSSPVMLTLREERKCAYIASNSLVPPDGKWHTVPVPLLSLSLMPSHSDPNGKLDLEKIKMIAIGASCRPSKSIDFELKSVYMVK